MKKRWKSTILATLIFVVVGVTFTLLFLWVNKGDIVIQSPTESDISLNSNPNPDLTLNRQAFKSDTPPVIIKFYLAKDGDNLWNIAKRNNLDWYTILSVNNLKNASDISIGELLKIPDRRGVIHVVSKGETLEDIALKYDTDIKKIIGANKISTISDIRLGAELFIPDINISIKQGLELMASRGVIKATRGLEHFIFPIAGRRKITSLFGFRLHPIFGERAFHRGIDIKCRYNSTVRAIRNGKVTFAGMMGEYGNLVVIEHGDGYSSRYGHNSELLVRKGQYVKGGEPIAKSGSTGLTTGPHLHFEVWSRGRPENPLKLIPR